MEELTRWLVEQEITIVYAPTSFFKQWLDAFVTKEQFPHLKLIMVIGQVLHKREVALFKDRFKENTILVNRLGLSESGGLTCYFIDHKVDISSDIVPVGYAIDDKDIFLTDDSGQEVQPGTIGEIRVRSRYLSSGYWRNPQLTEQKFLPDPSGGDKRILLTGDLGRFSEDGCLEYIGRKDNMVKIRGFRVETDAIDAALRSLETVKDVVVVAKEDSAGEERLVAYLVPQTFSTPSVSELRRLLADSLPEYMIPSFFVIMDALPLNQNGKIARSELPPPDFGRPKLEVPYTAPSNKTESQLVEIWQKVLGVGPIGVKDNFNDLGGESLLAMQLVLEVERFYRHAFQAKKLLGFPTVAEMARMIDSATPVDVSLYPKHEKNNRSQFRGKYRLVAAMVAGAKKMIGTTVQDYIQPNSKSQSRRRSQLSSVDYLRMLAVIAMRQKGPIKPGSLMTGMNTAGVRKPLFWCSNGYAATEALGELVHPEQPIYGLYNGSGTLFPRPKLLDQREREQLSGLFKILAAHYVNEILNVKPHGPYILGGNCVGGKLAVEIAMQLQERGKDVERLCLIETFDERLFDFQGAMLLLYGDQSHLCAYKPFRWREPSWQESFKSVPLVEWLPGAHGQFFSEPTIHVTTERINMFLQELEEH
jgi:thioesterase domain-containing protein/acyl carrier protein